MLILHKTRAVAFSTIFSDILADQTAWGGGEGWEAGGGVVFRKKRYVTFERPPKAKPNGAFEFGRIYEFRLGNSVRVLVRLVFTSRELEMKTAARVGTRMYEFMRSNNS